jgi:hypothetical protein
MNFTFHTTVIAVKQAEDELEEGEQAEGEHTEVESRLMVSRLRLSRLLEKCLKSFHN